MGYIYIYILTAECLAAGALDEALVRASLVAGGAAGGLVGLGVGALESRGFIIIFGAADDEYCRDVLRRSGLHHHSQRRHAHQQGQAHHTTAARHGGRAGLDDTASSPQEVRLLLLATARSRYVYI
jgi:hypothetical protein